MKNKNTKKEEKILERYYDSDIYGLDYAYERASVYKYRAERAILDEMNEKGGFGYRILGYNSCTFSCGYIYEENGQKHFVYHTKDNRLDFIIFE